MWAIDFSISSLLRCQDTIQREQSIINNVSKKFGRKFQVEFCCKLRQRSNPVRNKNHRNYMHEADHHYLDKLLK